MDGVEDLAADLLVAEQVEDPHVVTAIGPCQIFRRQVGAVVFEQVDAVELEVVAGLEPDGHDQSAPQPGEFQVRALDAELHFLDGGAGFRKGCHRSGDGLGDGRLDGKDVEIGAVGDFPALE